MSFVENDVMVLVDHTGQKQVKTSELWQSFQVIDWDISMWNKHQEGLSSIICCSFGHSTSNRLWTKQR